MSRKRIADAYLSQRDSQEVSSLESDQLASMYAQIVNGTPKEESRYVVDDESSQLWDQISREVAEIGTQHPGAILDIPD